MNDFTKEEHEEVMTADMKECQAICSFNENGKTRATLISRMFISPVYCAGDIATQIILGLVDVEENIPNEWLDGMINNLQKLKSNNDEGYKLYNKETEE